MLNAFVLVLVSAVGAVIMPFARRSVAFEIAENKDAWFYTMYLLCLTGLLGIAITGDAFNAFVFLEISSLVDYVLIALGPGPPGAARRLPVPDHRHHRRDLLRDRRRPPLPDDRHASTWRLIAARLGDGAETPRRRPGGARLHHRRHQPEARAVPAACLAAQRLRLRAVMATVFLAATATKVAIYLLAAVLSSRSSARASIFADLPVDGGLHRPLGRRDLRRVGDRRLPDRPEADVRLFVGGADRLHHPRHRAWNQAGLTGGARASPQPRADEGRALPARSAPSSSASGRCSSTTSPASGRRCRSPWRRSRSPGFGLVGMPGTAGFISKWYLVVGALELGWWWLAAPDRGELADHGGLCRAGAWRWPGSASRRRRSPMPPTRRSPCCCRSSVLAAATVYFGIDTRLTAGMAAARGRGADRGLR